MRKKICPQHGVYTGKKCNVCTKQNNKKYDRNKRDKKMITFYNSKKWRDTSGNFLKNNPICIRCGYPAFITDHIEEIKDGGSQYDFKNLQPMCKSCHNTKTSEQKKQRGGGVKSLESETQNADTPAKFLKKQILGGGGKINDTDFMGGGQNGQLRDN